MVSYQQRRKALRRIIYIAVIGAAIFSRLLYRSAVASTALLVRLYHDQDGTGTVTNGDIVADGVIVTITEANCIGQVCAASPNAWSVTTDADGYAAITLHDGEYEIAAPCMVMTVQASDVSGQGVQDVTTCGLWRMWMAEVWR